MLFFPKINLVSFGNETAGLRVDDLMLLGLAVIFFWGRLSSNSKIFDVEWLVFAITGWSIFSFVVNRIFLTTDLIHVSSKIFYTVRLLEYFMFFYIGAMATGFFKLPTLINAFFVWNTSIMLFQKLGLIGQFTAAGYERSVSDRVLGISAFGSEAGMLMNFLFCYLIFGDSRSSKAMLLIPAIVRRFVNRFYVYLLFLLFVVLAVMSGARISILAILLAFIFRVKSDLNLNRPMTFLTPLLVLGVAGALVMTLVSQNTEMLNRSGGLLSFDNLTLIGDVWGGINLDYDPIGDESTEMYQYDASWWLRVQKWCYALKIFWLNPQCYIQGVGPGFAMAAVDGGYVRILAETGIVGFFMYCWFFMSMYSKSKQLKWMMMAFFTNMLFFDVYLAYKPMAFLLFVTGYACSELAHNRRRLKTDERTAETTVTSLESREQGFHQSAF